MAAHGSSIAALQSSLTTGLSNKADQSAFDVLEGVVATKSTPDGVDLKRFHRLGQQRHTGHGGRQLRPQDGGGPALPGHSGEDHAAGGGHQGGQRSPGGRHRRGAGLRAREQRRLHLGAAGLQGGRQRPAVGRRTTAALNAALLGKADASALASLLSTVDGLPLEVDTKIANALLGLATEAFVAAQLASRDASITAL